MEDLKTLLPILALLISVTGLLYQHFGVIMKLKDDIAIIKTDTATIKVQTDLFWHIIENRTADLLKSYPTHLSKDILIDKYKNRELSLSDAEELRTILNGEQQQIKDNQFAYILTIARLEQVIYQLRSGGKIARILDDISR